MLPTSSSVTPKMVPRLPLFQELPGPLYIGVSHGPAAPIGAAPWFWKSTTVSTPLSNPDRFGLQNVAAATVPVNPANAVSPYCGLVAQHSTLTESQVWLPACAPALWGRLQRRNRVAANSAAVCQRGVLGIGGLRMRETAMWT